MYYVLKTNIPQNKSIFFSLLSIYGVGCSRSRLICHTLGFLRTLKVRNLTEEQFLDLTNLMKKLAFHTVLANDLKKSLKQNQKRLASIGLYRGIRLKQGLPARGQRTHSNAQTASRFVSRYQQQEKQVKTNKKPSKKIKKNKKK